MKTASPQSVTQRKPETLGSTPKANFSWFVWHNFLSEFPEVWVREELVSVELSLVKWTTKTRAFLSFYLSGGSGDPSRAPPPPRELIVIQSWACLCGSARSSEKHTQVRALSGAGAVGKDPRIQELCERPGSTENNLWTSLFQVMQLWKRNPPPRHLRRQVIFTSSIWGWESSAVRGFSFARLDWALASGPRRPPLPLPESSSAFFRPNFPQEPLHSLVPYPLSLLVFSPASPVVSLAIGTSYGIIQY